MAGATLVGVVPGLAGVMRVVTSLDRHVDEGFFTPMRQLRATWRRDLPVSLTFVVVAVMALVNLWAIINVESSVRVAVSGFLIPVVWVVTIMGSAYVAAASAQPWHASREQVLGLTAVLVKQRPVRALLTPLLLLGLLPVVLLPPLTVAVGLSLPAWVAGEWWGVRRWREELDPAPDVKPLPDPDDLDLRWRRMAQQNLARERSHDPQAG